LVYKNTSTTGNISFQSPASSFAFTNFVHTVVAADMNKDGKMDLVIGNGELTGNYVTVMLNTGSGSIAFGNTVTMLAEGSPFGISVNDLDGDGWLDVVATSSLGSNVISLFRNTSTTGNFSMASRVNLTTVYKPYGVTTADMNADGKVDIVAGCIFSETSPSPGYATVFVNGITNTTALPSVTAAESGITVSPNPFHSRIAVKAGKSLNDAGLRLVDVSGRVVAEYFYKRIEKDKIVFLPAEDLARGIYFLQVITKQWVMVEKVVKQ
jgi:hypothetical protein